MTTIASPERDSLTREAPAWRTILAGIRAPTPLWLEAGPRGAQGGARAAPPRRLEAALGRDRLAGLRALERSHGAGLLTCVRTAWALLLSRASGEARVLLGGGARDALLPATIDLEAGVAATLRAHEERWAALEEGPAPSEEDLRAWCDAAPGRPLAESRVAGGPCATEGRAAVEIVVAAAEEEATLSVACDPGRFDGDAEPRILDALLAVLDGFARDPAAPLGDVPLLSADERRRVLHEWNDTSGTPEDGTVHAVFAAQAALRPGAPAVLCGDRALSYGDLARRASRLARRLRALGVTREAPVALCLERTEEAVVALVAILEAGGCYLPLDPAYPRERIAFMLEDAGAAVIVTQASLRGVIGPAAARVLLVDGAEDAAAIAAESDAPLASEGTPEDLAYIMYTSGSTGTPKGVLVPHRGITRLVLRCGYADLGPGRTLLHAAPLAFDASTFEVWGALLHGGRLALHPEPVPTARGLEAAIARHGVTTMWLTASLFNAVVDERPASLRGLSELLIGGEALSVRHVRRALDALPSTRIINGYGPTECTTFAACHAIPRDLDPAARSIPIGRPIRETRIHVLDRRMRPVPAGIEGELYIGGRGVARGYLRRPELTAERFVADPFAEDPAARLYRTGDLARRRPDGTIDYAGRADAQVKVRGFRIELGEVEACLALHASVASCAAVVREDVPSQKRIVAYFVARPPAPSIAALRAHLAAKLPAHMLPSALVRLEALPVTANGKLDRRALPRPASARPDTGREYAAPRDPREEALCAVFADVLGLDRVGIHDGFFESGGDSLLALRALARLREAHGLDIPAVELFRAPTAAALARFLEAGPGDGGFRERVLRRERALESSLAHAAREPVAIVGMAGRFPGAASVEEMWRNVREGRETTTFFAEEDLDPSIPAALRADPCYVRARGVLEGVDLFDAGLFGVSPSEAELTDPQQRVLLEVAWEALESAGIAPGATEQVIGVFAGKYNATYVTENIAARPDLVERLGAFQVMVANEKDYVATRLAHRLGLTGPAVSVHTACSTSLVAVCQAVASLQLGECDAALAGGVSILCPPRSGYLYQEGAMLSADGHCRPFDAEARGTVFSDGAGLVVLKRLSDARRDGDTIHAVIRGAAVNNDGARKASFTAPSVDGQAAVIALAQARAGVDPRTIGYVEAHGTATPLGDPIEVAALTQAFRARTADRGFCALGSVKSNFGHLVIAAGVAGLLKAALALRDRTIPPSLHFRAPNPKIDFEASPFYVSDRLAPWPEGATPRRAGVSSFGVGGTNAHVVLEEAPPLEEAGEAEARPAPAPRHLLLLSARSEAALEQATSRLAAHLRARPGACMADVAYTLAVGRQAFACRRALVCAGAADALAGLADPSRLASGRAPSKEPAVAFLFPGQGSQYVGMGASLHRGARVFREVVDACAETLREVLGRDLRDLVYADGDPEAARAALRETWVTQPALFATEYALARLWESLGVRPAVMIGHSVGEFVCAALAGVMAPMDALRLVAERARLMQALPPGAMLSVRLPAAPLEERLRAAGGALALASENGPSLSVVAGPTEAVEALERALASEGVACRRLHTSHAFHSPMMDPIVAPFEEAISRVRLSPPRVPFVSTVTGRAITAGEATSPVYWARHLRATVRFGAGLRTLCEEGGRVLLEVGPRATLATLARQHAAGLAAGGARPALVAASLGEAPGDAEWGALLDAAGRLFTAGVPLDRGALHAGERRRRVPLPGYPFERKRYWIDPAARRESTTARPEEPSMTTCAPAPTAPSVPSAPAGPSEASPPPARGTASPRTARLTREVLALLEEVSGLELAGADPGTSFLELGLDSLTLTQVALQTQPRLGVRVTFRQLMEAHRSPAGLVAHLESELPPESPAAPAAPPGAAPAVAATAPAAVAPAPLPMPGLAPAALAAAPGDIRLLVERQLQVMAAQLALLSGAAPAPTPAPTPAPAAPSAPPCGAPAAPTPAPAAKAVSKPVEAEEQDPAKPVGYDVKKAFGAIARIHSASTELTPRQRARLDAFVRRYCARTARSKSWTQEGRERLADPRVVSGFRPALKELVYQVVIDRSQGARIWDLDGNEYVDVLCGFGASFFGWQPPFVTEAVQRQLERGHEIGPMHPLPAEVARLVCELTGFDRAAFCNTGSEAVMGAMRMARTVTGRQTIALFTGSYHGIFDEVIVRGTRSLRSVVAAPGIMPSTVQNVLVLDYGTPASLEVLRARGAELAAVLVEPVQSRRPDFQPREFLHACRELTERCGAALIFDEVITGFRSHPGGAQAVFGVRADIGTYGKVVGGGLPIGVIAGKRAYMDALDGGSWRFGDDSAPTVGVTYFAGTFCRHPLALAAAKASLEHMKAAGPSLQEEMNARTSRFAAEVNALFEELEAPLRVKHFASLWKPFFTSEQPMEPLLFAMMRDRGVHILDGFPCFFTTAHTDADVAHVLRAFRESIVEMQESGFLPEPSRRAAGSASIDASRPPLAGARLGRDASGEAAWFVPNPAEPGKFMQVAG